MEVAGVSEIYVYGEGPQPATVMLVGERPGIAESKSRRPFSEYGKSGKELTRYLHNEGVERENCYVTNLVKDYLPNDPDPTDEEIARDRPLLVEELKKVRPKFIGCVGRFAAREFLGQDFDMEALHGLPFETKHRRVMALYHPAFGLHKPSATVLVWNDFVQFGRMVRGVLDIAPRIDQYPDPEYILLKDRLPLFMVDQPIYLDTEGSIQNPWGLSFTQEPGKGYVILAKNTQLLKRLAATIKKLDLLVVVHNALHDLGVLRVMGIEDFRFEDSMVKAYHTCLLPQGLKALSKRLCGVEQDDYEGVVGEANRNKAVDWLVRAHDWLSEREQNAERNSDRKGRRQKSAVA